MEGGTQYMKYGTECLDSISQKIIEGELRHKDSVIIDDNSCGKSELLKVLINKNGIKENIYFIDNKFYVILLKF